MDQVLCGICAPSGAGSYQREIRQFLWSHRSEKETDLVIISGDTSFKVHRAVILPLSAHLTELLPPSCPCTKPAICIPPFPSHVLTAAVEILYTGTTTITASQEDQVQVEEVFSLLKIKADVDRDTNIEATKMKIFQQVEEDLEAMFADLEDSDTEKRTSESPLNEPKEKKGDLSTGTVSEGVIPKNEPNDPLAIPEIVHKITPPHQDIHSGYLSEVTGVIYNDERENVSGLDKLKSCKNKEPSSTFKYTQSQGQNGLALILNEATGVFCYDERQNVSGLDENCKINIHENVQIVAENDDVTPIGEKVFKFDNNENESLKKHEYDITKCPNQAKRKNVTLSAFGSEEEHPSISSQTLKLRARKRKVKEPDEVRKGIKGLDRNLLSSESKPQPGNKKLKVIRLIKPELPKGKQKFYSVSSTLACSKCDYTSNSKHNLNRHIDGVHKKILYNCNECDYTTAWKIALKGHIHAAHQNTYFNCDQCDFKTMWKISLKNHMDAHKKIYFKCDQCDYETTWKGTFKRHIEGLHGNIVYNCNQCNYKTTWKNLLQRHIKSMHAGVSRSCSQRNPKAVDKPAVPSRKSVHGEVAANCRTRSQKMSLDVAAAVNSIPRVSENPGPSNDEAEQKRVKKKSKAKGDAAFLW